MKEASVELLERHGWVVECESPFEIRHEDGSFATENAAWIVLEYITEYLKLVEMVEIIESK